MKKFILLTFGFLSWAFYEMSGGADFEPVSQRVALAEPVTETQTPATAPTVVAAKKPVIDTDPPLNDTVTRVSLNLTTLKEVLDEPAPEEALAETTSVDDVIGVPVNVDASLSSANTPAIIPSLIVPNDTGLAAQPASLTSAQGDVRTVTGNTVNVRGGPGTDYEVVTKLNRGDAVEVLVDNGDGWVMMRPLDGGTEGWMADFLLVGG